MESIRIDILNPKAKKLLKNLADLNLIRINKTEKTDFKAFIEKLRTQSTDEMSFEEIAHEVEEVRKSRYGK